MSAVTRSLSSASIDWSRGNVVPLTGPVVKFGPPTVAVTAATLLPIVAADGAEKAVVTTINPREIEVSLAGNRYRLPATVKQ